MFRALKGPSDSYFLAAAHVPMYTTALATKNLARGFVTTEQNSDAATVKITNR